MNSPCLYVRTTPALTAPFTACIPWGTIITIDCTTSGQGASGPWGISKVWDHTSYNGATGYVPDARVYTATAKPVAHAC
jgi:hypothetical protein